MLLEGEVRPRLASEAKEQIGHILLLVSITLEVGAQCRDEGSAGGKGSVANDLGSNRHLEKNLGRVDCVMWVESCVVTLESVKSQMVSVI